MCAALFDLTQNVQHHGRIQCCNWMSANQREDVSFQSIKVVMSGAQLPLCELRSMPFSSDNLKG